MWQETRPLVFTSGYSWKEIPPEDGKVLFIFPLLINPFKKIQRDQADVELKNKFGQLIDASFRPIFSPSVGRSVGSSVRHARY